MKKRSMHLIHIGEDVWKWWVNRRRGMNLIIFDPKGKRHEVTGMEFRISEGADKIAALYEDMEHTITYTPARVKDFICSRILLRSRVVV